MNSIKKQNRPIEEPLFKMDPETGKMIPLPRKWPSPGSAKVKSDKKGKRMLTIAPLVLTAADFEEAPNRTTKIRKVDNNSVRKELFNLPYKGSQISRPSMTTRRTLSRRSITSQKVQKKKFKPSELSPLLDMEEVEEELIKKKGFLQGYPFKTPSKPAIKFCENLKTTPFRGQVTLIPKIKITQTPDSMSSNESEFLQLEKICLVEDQRKENALDKSPISSVCNLLEETVINSSKKEKKNGITNIQQNVINDIKNILIECSTAFEEYKVSHENNISKIADLLETDRQQYETLVALQDKNKSAITGILKTLKCASSDSVAHMEANKENTPIHNRRSMRLLNKSPRQTHDAKLVVSPSVLKSKDLRKSTLTKNLVTKSKQYNIESPRIKKALDMYNSMRCEISVLATPKFERNYLESPRSTNLSRNLSRRVQSQCLLLQDTPIRK